MSSASARTDRRRRVLQDGVLSTAATSPVASDENANINRYAANEDSVSFAVARRVVPHRRRAIFGVVTLGVLGTAALLAGHHYQPEILQAAGLAAIPAIDLRAEASLAEWTASAGVLVAAVMCMLLYGLRRRRSDDTRGVYRWWLTAALAWTAVGVCRATGLHVSLASLAAIKSGWSLPGGEAVWWAAPATVLLGAIAIRTLLDLKHCVPALLSMLLAAACGGVAIAAAYGFLPAAVAPPELIGAELMIAEGCLLIGLLATITGQLAYCRRIVLEADGAIQAPVQKPLKKPTKKPAAKAEKQAKATAAKTAQKAAKSTTAGSAAATTSSVRPTATRAPAATTTRPAASAATRAAEPRAARPQAASATTQWTDGSEGDSDYGDGGEPRRKLTKAERKRLRKLKARQNRAA